jgi:hypothetical protein
MGAHQGLGHGGGAPVRGEGVRRVHEILQDSGPPLDLCTGKRSR